MPLYNFKMKIYTQPTESSCFSLFLFSLGINAGSEREHGQRAEQRRGRDPRAPDQRLHHRQGIRPRSRRPAAVTLIIFVVVDSAGYNRKRNAPPMRHIDLRITMGKSRICK